jgi:hypothetical protein
MTLSGQQTCKKASSTRDLCSLFVVVISLFLIRLSCLKYPLDPYPTRVLGKHPSQSFQAGLKLRPFGAVTNHREASSFFLIAIRLGAVGLCKECFGFHLADDVVVCCSRTRVGTIFHLWVVIVAAIDAKKSLTPVILSDDGTVAAAVVSCVFLIRFVHIVGGRAGVGGVGDKQRPCSALP